MKHEQNKGMALGCWNSHSGCLQRREVNDCTVFRHTKICNLIYLMFLKARLFSITSVSSGALCQAEKHSKGGNMNLIQVSASGFPCQSLWPQTTHPPRWRNEYQALYTVEHSQSSAPATIHVI